MEREIFTIESKDQWLGLRAGVLTSTDCATLFGLSPYQTMFELWHKKKEGLVVSLTENERMKWGNRLEAAIAQGVAEEKGWKVSPMKDFFQAPNERIGSSFDFKIEDEEAILEIKNVDSLIYRDQWTEEEAPPHIELQVQFQMLVSGLSKAWICALVGGNDMKLIERTADNEIQNEILRRAAIFWKSIDDNNEPKPNYETDAEYVIRLHQYAEPNKFYTGDVAELRKIAKKYKKISALESKLDDKKKAIKARCLEIIGDSEKVKESDFSISAGIVGEKVVAYTSKPHRDFRIFLKKEK